MGHRNNQHAGNVVLPGSVAQQFVSLDVKPHQGPHAVPISVAVPTGTGMEIHTWGGFTKLEEAALRIAAGLAANPAYQAAEDEIMARRAADLAVKTLEACGELLKQRAEEAKTNEHDG